MKNIKIAFGIALASSLVMLVIQFIVIFLLLPLLGYSQFSIILLYVSPFSAIVVTFLVIRYLSRKGVQISAIESFLISAYFLVFFLLGILISQIIIGTIKNPENFLHVVKLVSIFALLPFVMFQGNGASLFLIFGRIIALFAIVTLPMAMVIYFTSRIFHATSKIFTDSR